MYCKRNKRTQQIMIAVEPDVKLINNMSNMK